MCLSHGLLSLAQREVIAVCKQTKWANISRGQSLFCLKQAQAEQRAKLVSPAVFQPSCVRQPTLPCHRISSHYFSSRAKPITGLFQKTWSEFNAESSQSSEAFFWTFGLFTVVLHFKPLWTKRVLFLNHVIIHKKVIPGVCCRDISRR